MTGEKIAIEAMRLLDDTEAMQGMRAGLKEVAAKLASDRDPMEIAADCIQKVVNEKVSRN